MRVTNSATYRNYTSSVNDVHAQLNRSMNKISSGKQYENAAESPLSYYRGKRIDDQYQDALSKASLLTDVKNRIYQQELGARDIQKILADAKNKVQEARTGTTSDEALKTLQADLLQKEHQIIDDLNGQYENFYIYGGNDLSSTPFTLSADGSTLTYTHKFASHPDESLSIEMKLEYQGAAEDPPYQFNITSVKDSKGNSVVKDNQGNPITNPTPEQISKYGKTLLVEAMSEQGRVDIGYGDISSKNPQYTAKDLDIRDTLLDTYTGGFNLLTGISSDEVIARKNADPPANPAVEDYIMERLNKSPLALIGQASLAINNNLSGDAATINNEELHDILGQTIEDMTVTEHTVSTVYSDLGNKYKLLEDTDAKLKILQDSLTEQYKDILGADPYASVLEMYNNNYAYNAALRVGSQLMSSSLFDFMR